LKKRYFTFSKKESQRKDSKLFLIDDLEDSTPQEPEKSGILELDNKVRFYQNKKKFSLMKKTFLACQNMTKQKQNFEIPSEIPPKLDPKPEIHDKSLLS